MSDTSQQTKAEQAPATGEAGNSPVAPEQVAEQTGPEVRTVEETPTAEEIAELKARAAKAEEHWNRLLRTVADFDNYRKRVAGEKQRAVQYANSELMLKLIPVLDSFEMAIAAVPEGDTAARAWHEGLAMVRQQFKNVLEESGLVEIDAVGQTFNPACHEAVAQQESAEAPEGQVLQQLRKGYRFHDRLLRPAAVIVAKKPAA